MQIIRDQGQFQRAVLVPELFGSFREPLILHNADRQGHLKELRRQDQAVKFRQQSHYMAEQ